MLRNVRALFTYVSGSRVRNDVVTGPKNTAARCGDTGVMLNCTVYTPTDYMEWREFLDEPQGRRIYSSFNDIILDDRFDIYRSGLDEDGQEDFNLIIKEVTRELAGTYMCRLILASQNELAELVSLSKYSNMLMTTLFKHSFKKHINTLLGERLGRTNTHQWQRGGGRTVYCAVFLR